MSFNFDENFIKENPKVILDYLHEFSKRFDDLTKRVSDLEIENQSLKAELKKYTSPHIPSSKQLFPKKRSGLPRSSSNRKRGGSKKGKSGSTWNEEPDEVIHNFVKECLSCHKVADETKQTIAYTKRINEIPEQIQVSLQEHHIYKHECECGKTTQAGDPTLEGTSLGPNLLSFLSSARKRTGGSFENLALMIEDLSGKKISQTTFNRGLSAVSQMLTPERDNIAHEVMNSEFINIDETGHKLVLEGKRAQQGSKKIWVWVFAIPTAAYYHVDLTRSQKAIETALTYHDENKPPPICVSDAYPAYMNMFEINQYCWAHLLRDTKEIEDTCLAGKILHDKMVDMFQKIKALQKKLREKNEPASDKVYDKALREINEIAKAKYCKNVEKIQKHLRKRVEYYLTCLKHPQIPMENGRAERLLKSVIVHRSNGKPLRSLRAMDEYGILLTVLTTWNLRGMPVGGTLREYIGKHINQAKLLD